MCRHDIMERMEQDHQPIESRFLPISILVAAVLISGSILFAVFYKGGAATPSPAVQQPQAAAPTSTISIMALSPRDAVLGDANASVTFIEYGDYQCPFCVQYFSQTQPLLIKKYVDSGKMKMVFRSFPFLGPESTAATEAAECAADQNQAWAYHSALYQAKAQDEQKGGSENDGSLNRTLFLKLAQQLGMDIPAFTTCIDTNKYASQVAQEKTVASAAGVDSTPVFFINGRQIMGAQPYANFQSVIDGLLSAK